MGRYPPWFSRPPSCSCDRRHRRARPFLGATPRDHGAREKVTPSPDGSPAFADLAKDSDRAQLVHPFLPRSLPTRMPSLCRNPGGCRKSYVETPRLDTEGRRHRNSRVISGRPGPRDRSREVVFDYYRTIGFRSICWPAPRNCRGRAPTTQPRTGRCSWPGWRCGCSGAQTRASTSTRA